MDDFERRVLRKKRDYIAENLTVTVDLLVRLRRVGIIPEEEVERLLKEESNVERVKAVLDHVTSCNDQSNPFEAFCVALTVDDAWLTKELENDVRTEKGNMKLDQDVLKEAGMMVHRQFGTSRRLSEMDKKDMADMIAIKIQMGKEEWRHELETLRKELTRVNDSYRDIDRAGRRLHDAMTDYIRSNEKALVSRAHGMHTTTHVLTTSAADDDVIGRCEEKLDYLTGRVSRCLQERDLLRDDRQRCMRLLDISEENNSIKLHQVMESKMAELPKKLELCQEEVKKKEQTVRRVRRLMQEYETDLAEKDDKLSKLQRSLTDKVTQMAVLEQQVRELEAEKAKAASHIATMQDHHHHHQHQAHTSPPPQQKAASSSASTAVNGNGKLKASATPRRAARSRTSSDMKLKTQK